MRTHISGCNDDQRQARNVRGECSLETYVENFPNRVEQPSVRVDLFLVLCLQNEYDLNRNQVVGIILVRQDEGGRRINGYLGRILIVDRKTAASVRYHANEILHPTNLTTCELKLTSKIWATVSLPSTCFFITPS